MLPTYIYVFDKIVDVINYLLQMFIYVCMYISVFLFICIHTHAYSYSTWYIKPTIRINAIENDTLTQLFNVCMHFVPKKKKEENIESIYSNMTYKSNYCRLTLLYSAE